MRCENCNEENWMRLVSYESFFFQCAICKNPGPATSFIAVKDSCKGEFEIIEVDNNLNQLRIIGKGYIENYIEIIAAEAGKGKIIWLKNVNQNFH